MEICFGNYNNRSNLDVKGVNFSEISTLFSGFGIHPRYLTLVPPLSKNLLPVLYFLFAAFRWLRSHTPSLLKLAGIDLARARPKRIL